MNQSADGIPPEFRSLLKGFRNLSAWALGAGAPFAAGLANLSPPWPSGIVPATAVVELVTLVLVCQLMREVSRTAVTRVLCIGALTFAVLGVLYLYALALYTFVVPTTKERFTKGFECTQDAMVVFGARCPRLGMDDLASAEYEADRLWTPGSIAIVQTGMAAAWASGFVALSTVLGSFLVFHGTGRSDPPPGGRAAATESGIRNTNHQSGSARARRATSKRRVQDAKGSSKPP
jgi:hypothetical protein